MRLESFRVRNYRSIGDSGDITIARITALLGRNESVGFQFTGQRYDPESGLYYLRARYYSPLLGRFISTDPLGRAPEAPRSFVAYARDTGQANETMGAEGALGFATLVGTMSPATVDSAGSSASVALVSAAQPVSGQLPGTGPQISGLASSTAPIGLGRASRATAFRFLYSVNLYTYGNMNPLGFSDPFGLSAEQIAALGPASGVVKLIVCILCTVTNGLYDPADVLEQPKPETVTPVPADPFRQEPPRQ